MSTYYIEVRDHNGEIRHEIEITTNASAAAAQPAATRFIEVCAYYDASHSVTLHRVD
jgi:hypothetical protein